MRTVIRKMGNSQGVIIPKPLLSEVGLTGEVEMSIENGAIVLRPPHQNAREGWAAASKALAKDGNDELAWPEFGNLGDKALKW
jgi:antitoxin MazE